MAGMAQFCPKGFETGDHIGDHPEGGALSAKHIDKYGDNFKNGMHKPTFHPDGLHKEMQAGGKTYETGFHYLLECHELGGKNKNGGYGGPLCSDPFGKEIQDIVQRLLVEADQATNLCFNNFTDPCPEVPRDQVEMCKGFDYGDKTLKLPGGPLPWPAGLPEPGYVPKTDPLNGRWVTVSGGQAEFIKKAVAEGMLGSAEMNKIASDVNVEATGGMFLRISQRGDVCTVDASVAKFARAKRTWKSGHYFYEPLVSGGNLLGVWVLPEEYRKIGFFYDMNSGKCFRIQRNAWYEGPYLFMRQSTEAFGKVSHVFYVKVDNDPESKPIPLQSRDYTALAGQNNTLTNLGNPYPCIARDIDYPKKRDTWLDTNEKEMMRQRKMVGKAFDHPSAKGDKHDATKVIGMGWSTPVLDVTMDGLWEALVYKAKNPEKFMDVSNVTVTDQDGFLARSMTITDTNKRVDEHIYANYRTREFIYRVVTPSTKREEEEERVIAVKQEPTHLEFFQRHVSDGYRSYWQAPMDVVQKLVDGIVLQAKKLESNSEPVIGLGFITPKLEGVSHADVWRAMVESIRDPQNIMMQPEVSIIECTGYLNRTMTCTQRIYVNEPDCEIVYRQVVDGKETGMERVQALRNLQMEFCDRNTKDGFRISSNLTKEMALGAAHVIETRAKRAARLPPTIIGYGVSSDPLQNCSYDSLFIAIEVSIKQPWKVLDVYEDSVDIRDFDGYVQRKMKLKSTNETVVEKITINEEKGEVTYNKCSADGRPSTVERVLAVHTPLALEFYERNAIDGVRVEWKAPYSVACKVIDDLLKIAVEVEKSTTDVVGYGLASKPMSDIPQDTLWRAMLYSVRNPSNCGMDVDTVQVKDMAGYMSRSMRLIGKNTTVTDNVYVLESAQEIVYRPVINQKESEEERVFALRTNPLRCEMFCRLTKDEMRVHWKVPKAVCLTVFDAASSVAVRMLNGEL